MENPVRRSPTSIINLQRWDWWVRWPISVFPQKLDCSMKRWEGLVDVYDGKTYIIQDEREETSLSVFGRTLQLCALPPKHPLIKPQVSLSQIPSHQIWWHTLLLGALSKSVVPSKNIHTLAPADDSCVRWILGHQLCVWKCILQFKKEKESQGKSLICFDPSLQSASTRVTKTKTSVQWKTERQIKRFWKINPQKQKKRFT